MAPRLLEQPPAPPADASVTKRRIRLDPRRHDDERLARHVADRHDNAFAALYERYHQPLYRYCRSLLHHDADAQDALQSTFTSALVALREDRRDAPLRPWLFRIAHNEAISLIRRRRDGDHELSESLLPPAPSAADEARDRARLALLVADLAHLPDRQRGALLMRELSGLSHAEIAVALGTTSGAAKQAIFEARTALLEFAEGRAAPCEDIRRRLSERDGRVLRNRRLRSHLRDCSSCDAFAAAIGQRRADLRAIAPALPLVASAGLLARIARGGGDQGMSGLAAGGAAAGAAGKFGGAALISKSLATIAAALTTVAGVAGLHSTLDLAGHASHHVQGSAAPVVSSPISRRSHAAGTSPHRSANAAARSSRSRRHAVSGATQASVTRTSGQPRPTNTRTHAAQGPAHVGSSVDEQRSATPAQSSPAAHQNGVAATPPATTSSPSRTPAGHSVAAPGKSSAAPGHGGSSPGYSANSNGASNSAPGHTGTTPSHGGTPPGHGATPPGQTISAPVQPAAATTGPVDGARGNSAAAPGHAKSPPGQLNK